MENKRVFVTGGAGVIGTVLVEKLLERGASVFVGDLKPCPKRWLGKLKYRQGDLNALTAPELAAFDPQIIFHLAATFERSEENYGFFNENFHHNVRLTHHLLQCAKDLSSLSQVVLASSYLIHDPRLYLSEEEPKGVVEIKENSPVYPRNICGAAKFFNELELHFLSQFKKEIAFCSARIYRVYGRGSRDVVSRWVRSALRHEKLTVYRPEGRFDYIFADDVAEGLFRLAQAGATGAVNLGTGHARPVSDVLAILKQAFSDLHVETLSSDIPFENSQAAIHKLKEWTGWQPETDLESGIKQLIEYETQQLHYPPTIQKQANVLITSISKKMPLINAVRTAVTKTSFYEFVFGADSHPDCIGQYGVDEFWNWPSLHKLPIDDFLSHCREKSITAIIPTRDGELDYFAQHKQALLEEGIFTLVSDRGVIETCLDKYLFAQCLMRERFPVIKTELSIEALHTPRYVVKERRGAGSHQIGLNLSREEALEHAQKLSQPIFQPYIQGQEWSIDLYRTRKGHIKGVVTRQRNVVAGGESQVTTTTAFPPLEQLCRRLADHLALYGHAVFQVIEDANGDFHVIECNPRFGGASTASLAVGLDSFVWFLMESKGINLDDTPFLRTKHEVKQVRYLVDKIITLENGDA